MSFFLPYKLTPQGWLTDMLMGQIYHDDNFDLRALIHGRQQSKADLWAFYQDNKLFYLNPNHKNLLETQIIPMMVSDPSTLPVMDKQKKAEYVDFLMNITPAQQAALIPYIRLYIMDRPAAKKGAKKNKNKWKTRDIIFKEFTDTDFILSNKFSRGGGAGITNVQVTRKFNYFGLANDFRINIDYFFSSMSTFARGHPAGGETWGEHVAAANSTAADYVKIIEPIGAGRTKCVNGKKVFIPEEKLYLEYGWKFNPNISWELMPFSTGGILDEHSFIKEERKVLELTWIKHDFSFKENGEISLKASYVGAPLADLYKEENDVLEIGNEKLLKGIFSEEGAKEINEAQESIKQAKKARKELLEDCKEDVTEAAKKSTKCKKAKQEKTIKSAQKKLNKAKKTLAKNVADMLIRIVAQNGFLFKAVFNSGRTEKGGAASKIIKGKPSEKLYKHHFDVGIGPVHTPFREDQGEKISWMAGTNSILGHIEQFGGTDTSENPSVRAHVMQEAWEAKTVLKQNNSQAEDEGFPKLEKQIEYTGEKNPALASIREELVEMAGKDPRVVEQVDRLIGALTNSGHTDETGHETSTYGNFYFFPLRALIGCAYELASEEERQKMPLVCLGNVATRVMGKPVWVNIGDILVEVDVFYKWVFNTVIRKGRNMWTFGEFMDSIINELVPNVLYGYSTGEHGQTNFGAIQKSLYMVEEDFDMFFYDPTSGDSILPDDFYYNDKAPKDHLTSLAAALKKPKKGGGKSFIFYHQVVSETSRESGVTTPLLQDIDLACKKFDRKKNHKEGLYHIHIGEDKGILRNINFSFQDDAYLRSALFFDKGKDGTLPFLKYTYNAQPSMMGNNLFSKGAYFVIPVNPLGVSEEEDPGLRGYYRIHSMVDAIKPGEYTTSVEGTNMGPGKAKCAALKKAAAEKKPDPQDVATSFVWHDIGEYIVNDLLEIGNIKKAYNLKRKPFDPCEKPDPKASPPESKPPVKKKCPPNSTWSTAKGRCSCKNGFWWSKSKKKCYCPKKKTIKGKKCVGKTGGKCKPPSVWDSFNKKCVVEMGPGVYGPDGKLISSNQTVPVEVKPGTTTVVTKKYAYATLTEQELAGKNLTANQCITINAPTQIDKLVKALTGETPPAYAVEDLLKVEDDE
jgi:hypothetical protein